MQTNNAIAQKTDDEITLSRIIQHEVETTVQSNSVPLQYILGADNLTPEQLEMVYMIKLRELKMMSDVKNYIELKSLDLLSKVHMACYKAEDFLSTVINQALNLIRMPYSNISLRCDTKNTVILDARKTSMIIYNLISNALIHSKASEKEINISAKMRGNDFVISVTDNGKGIPASKQKQIFKSYADISAIESLSADLMALRGMGLAVSRKAAHDMKGDLVYVNAKKNTTFEIIIPQQVKPILNEPVEYIADMEFVLFHLATANLIYIENCRN